MYKERGWQPGGQRKAALAHHWIYRRWGDVAHGFSHGGTLGT
jgi:hypothetical protein